MAFTEIFRSAGRKKKTETEKKSSPATKIFIISRKNKASEKKRGEE